MRGRAYLRRFQSYKHFLCAFDDTDSHAAAIDAVGWRLQARSIGGSGAAQVEASS